VRAARAERGQAAVKLKRSDGRVQIDLTVEEAGVFLEELSHVRGGSRLPKLRQICAGAGNDARASGADPEEDLISTRSIIYMTWKTLAPVLFVLVGCGGGQFTGSSTPAESSPDSGATVEADSGSSADGSVTVGSTGGSTGGRVDGAFDHGDAAGSGADDAASDNGTGGAPGTGGRAPGAGGIVGTGGAPGSGGVSGEGGAPAPDACALVTHNNGLGQTWQDCVPLGTYNEAQAMKACAASGAALCLPTTSAAACTIFDHEKVYGYDANGVLIARWGHAGSIAGYYAPIGAGLCDAPTAHPDWRWY